MKSKILTLLLAGVMSISLVSCGGAAKAPEASGSAQASEAAAVSDTEAASSDADIAIENGGAIRAVIDKGDITYGDIISVKPFGNAVCVIEVTGQQILDALEWGSRYVPEESGAFLQVSGLSYEINSALDNPCTEDENVLSYTEAVKLLRSA